MAELRNHAGLCKSLLACNCKQQQQQQRQQQQAHLYGKHASWLPAPRQCRGARGCSRRRWACRPPSGCQSPAGSGCTSSCPRPAAACRQGRDAVRKWVQHTSGTGCSTAAAVCRIWQAAQPTGWQGVNIARYPPSVPLQTASVGPNAAALTLNHLCSTSQAPQFRWQFRRPG